MADCLLEVSEYLSRFSLDDGTGQLDIFSNFDRNETRIEYFHFNGKKIPLYINEFWTSKQRQASSIHEISYRACYKPQLPRFFIQLFTRKEDLVYDPFSGRGTTVIEAGLMGRRIISNDVNPLSEILARSRFFIPDYRQIEGRLSEIGRFKGLKADIDISMFYHPDTESEIVGLRNYLAKRKCFGEEDEIDAWIRMVATNRLTGHSRGFFSVYSLPPNQAITPQRQRLINQKLNQIPEYRDTHRLILAKTRSLLKNIGRAEKELLRKCGLSARFLCRDARMTPKIESESVTLTVTSPPFLDVVDYATDNWLRCWFNNIDINEISGKITTVKSLETWANIMSDVFRELYRITKPSGWVAFEVGEVKGGKIKLDEQIIPIAINSGFICQGVVINQQDFTKTANIWGVKNNNMGTNTNRIVLLQKKL